MILPSWRFSPILMAVVAVLQVTGSTAPDVLDGVGLTMQLECSAGRKPLIMNEIGGLTDCKKRALSVSRLDLLMSELAMQRADGSWVEVKGWHGFFRAGEPSRRMGISGIPKGSYRSVRFGIGVEKSANHSDPNRLPPEDPLHPISSGMHWGWQGGYVFMALEGHWQPDSAPDGLLGGFSYHLGNDEHYTMVEIPTALDLTESSVLVLKLDVERLLSGLNIAEDGETTHSRTEDRIVKMLKHNLQTAFTLHSESRQPGSAAASRRATGSGSSAPHGTPFPFALSANFPQMKLPADNVPTLEGVRLGEQIFRDKRLSKDNTLSCASCHVSEAGFSDPGKSFSVGVGGKLGVRNTMPIFNLAWSKEFFWDGRAQGLRNQALMPIQDPHEMAASLPEVERKLNADPIVASQFQEVFGAGGVTAAKVGLALEQFMLTQISQDSKFDRVTKGQGSFTPEEKRGFDLFLTEHDPYHGLFGADCFHCHGGALFTNQQFVNNGLPIADEDVGREKVTGNPADRGKFRTPSLRNVELTAPYMHDGRFKTLEEVIEHYDHGVQRTATLDPNLAKHPAEGLKISAADKKALVAFMKTLTDPACRTKTKTLPVQTAKLRK